MLMTWQMVGNCLYIIHTHMWFVALEFPLCPCILLFNLTIWSEDDWTGDPVATIHHSNPAMYLYI